MSKPTNSVSKIKDTRGTSYDIVPHQLTDGSYAVSLPSLSADATLSLEGHTHTKSQITDFPDSLKSPGALKVTDQAGTVVTYDGSEEKSITGVRSSYTAEVLSPVGNGLLTCSAVSSTYYNYLAEKTSGFAGAFATACFRTGAGNLPTNNSAYSILHFGYNQASNNGVELAISHDTTPKRVWIRWMTQPTTWYAMANYSDLPTKVSDLENDSGFTTNKGTVTSVAVKMNGSVKGTVTDSGTIDLGTVVTDVSGKADGTSSSTDNAIARFDGTSGKMLQNSAVTIDDDGGVVIPETAGLSVGALSISHNSSNDTYVIGTPGANESLALNVNGKGQIKIKDGNIKFMSCDALNSDDYGYAYSKLPINDGSTSSNYYTIATREYVSDVISGLDGIISGTAGASKTLSALSEADGKISATFTDIQIGESQVSNLLDDLTNKQDKLSPGSNVKIEDSVISVDLNAYAKTTDLSAYVLKGGDTLTSGATFTFADPGLGNVATSSATNCGGFKWTGKTDGIELYAECPTTADQQYLVIKMNDDNSNKVSFRNNGGTEVAYIGANGYASFSGTIYEGGTALSSKYSPLAGSSSLTTCSKGTFGTAVTYSTTTTVTSGSSALVTSDAVYQAIYGAMNTAV